MSSVAGASKFGRGLTGFIKQKWNDMPEVVGSSVIGVIGLGIGVWTANYYKKNNKDNRRYKHTYTVYRHDDPRVEFIRKD